jgi:membrane associated rhomboid family serine protease
MLPISDVIPSRTAPIVTVVLIAVNLLVFLYERSLADAQLQLFIGQYALIPAWFAWPALFSSQFLHAGWAHVLSNMLYLWIFGDNVEDRLGHGKFLVFYLFAGAAAAILQMVFNPFSAVPMVGASGAISGVMGAYFVMYPHSRVLTLVFFFLVEVPAIFFLGIYFVMQVLSGVGSLAASNAAGGGTAFWAHVGGFIFGAMMGAVLRARGYRRWDHDDAWLNERRY